MGEIIPFASPAVVAIDERAAEQSAARISRTPLGDLRASMRYCDFVRLANRAFRAAESANLADAEIARVTLRHIADNCPYPQGRGLASMFLGIMAKADAKC
jgi:hypothetical protein